MVHFQSATCFPRWKDLHMQKPLRRYATTVCTWMFLYLFLHVWLCIVVGKMDLEIAVCPPVTVPLYIRTAAFSHSTSATPSTKRKDRDDTWADRQSWDRLCQPRGGYLLLHKSSALPTRLTVWHPQPSSETDKCHSKSYLWRVIDLQGLVPLAEKTQICKTINICFGCEEFHCWVV